MIHYHPYRGKNAITPLKVHPKVLEARAARWWQLKPWEFRTLDPDKRAELYAIYTIEMEIESYYNSESLRKAEAPIPK